jgi:hypothetical protein
LWPWIWTRIAWIEIRRHWRAITLLDRSLAAMRRVFGEVNRIRFRRGGPVDPNPIHIDPELTKLTIDYAEAEAEFKKHTGVDVNRIDDPS